MFTEKRSYPRVEVSWPITVVTTSGLTSGTAANISQGGALIRFSIIPELAANFRILFRPTKKQVLGAVAQKVWSRSSTEDESTIYKMGVRFTYVSSEDLHLIREYLNKSEL